MTVTVEDMRVMLNLDDDEGEKLLLITYRVDTGDSSTYPIDATTNSIVGQLRGVYAVYAEEEANG